jgi:O-antigen ligase
MIRLSLLFAFIVSLALYAIKDWYVALCGLIALMAVLEHPDMPKTLFGVQGLNPWNILLLVVVAAWLGSRRRERLVWDMPRSVNVLLLAYLGVVLVGFFRMMADRARLPETTAFLVSEYLVNTVKWVVPGLLLYDGCRSRRRFLLGLAALSAIYVLLAVQVIKWMPAGAIMSGEGLAVRSSKILSNEIGYHRVNLSVMLAGASWAILATRGLARHFGTRALILFLALAVTYAQALTGGRAGYATWIAVGLVLGMVRWRRYLLALPLVAATILALVPAARERMLQGFTPETHDTSAFLASQDRDQDPDEPDAYTITAGRTLIWPYVVDKISEAPLVGYGREAMRRTGLTAFLLEEVGESFPHPHNAYLEWLLDNGLVGFVLTMPFYGMVVVLSFSLFRDSRSPTFVAAGGACLALVLALLFGAVGSQTFYPREGAVGMWAAIGLMLRTAVERQRAIRRARRDPRRCTATTAQPPQPDAGRARAGVRLGPPFVMPLHPRAGVNTDRVGGAGRGGVLPNGAASALSGPLDEEHPFEAPGGHGGRVPPGGQGGPRGAVACDGRGAASGPRGALRQGAPLCGGLLRGGLRGGTPFGDWAVLKLMHASLVRVSDRWRRISISEFERRQLGRQRPARQRLTFPAGTGLDPASASNAG